MADADMLRYLVHGVGADPTLTPLDPGYLYTRPQTEADPIYWYKLDAGLDVQRCDCYLVTRNGVQFAIRTFDYGGPSYPQGSWFTYDAPDDGGDCFRVSDIQLASGSVAHGVGDFYTHDGSAADVNGVWFFSPDCQKPSWLNWLNDVDGTLRNATPIGGSQQGGMAIVCPTTPQTGTAYTTYQRLTLPVPCSVNGVAQTPNLDCIVSMHYNIAPTDIRGDCERMIFARDLGEVQWSAWELPGSVVAGYTAEQRNAAMLAAGRAPAIAGLVDPIGLVMVDCRHSTDIRTVSAPNPLGTAFAWPPAGLLVPA
jgi:hypothetical protein